MVQTIPYDPILSLMVEDPDLYERYVLAMCNQDKDFFIKIRGVLCLNNRGVFSSDFENNVHYSIYRAMWAWHTVCAKNKQFAFSPIFPGMLEAQLYMLSKTDFRTLGKDDVPAACQYYTEFVAPITIEEAAPFVLPTYTRWLAKRKSQHIVRRFDADDYADPNLLSRELGTTISAINNTAMSTRKTFSQCVASDEVFIERIPVNSVPGFNVGLGGGLGKKEHMLIIAPSGAGKTVLACQIAACLALSRQKVMLITTEQSPVELVPRIISAQCSIPFNIIKDGGNYNDLLSADQYLKYSQLMDAIEPYLIFQDWSEVTDMSVVDDLDQMVAEEKERGGLDCVILDWIGGALGTEKTKKKDELRLIYQSAADAMAGIAKKHDLSAVSFAQATALSINKAKIGFTDTAECKTMHTAATSCAGVSALYSQGDDSEDTYAVRQLLYFSKSRKSQGRIFELKRDFGFQRFSLFRKDISNEELAR